MNYVNALNDGTRRGRSKVVWHFPENARESTCGGVIFS